MSSRCAITLVCPAVLLALWPAAQGEAEWTLQAVALGQAAFVGVGSVNYLLIMRGHPWQVLGNAVPGLVLNLALCLALLPTWGIAGAGVANAAAVALSSAIGVGQVYRLYGLHPLSTGLARSLAAALPAFAVAWLLAELPLAAVPHLAVVGSAVAAVYAASVVALGLEPEDRELVALAKARIYNRA